MNKENICPNCKLDELVFDTDEMGQTSDVCKCCGYEKTTVRIPTIDSNDPMDWELLEYESTKPYGCLQIMFMEENEPVLYPIINLDDYNQAIKNVFDILKNDETKTILDSLIFSKVKKGEIHTYKLY